MTHDKVSRIAAARERLEDVRREFDEFVGDWARCGRVRSGERHDKLNDLHRWLTSAVSDLLLALTAPAEAPARPERVAVLRHRDGWHVYSDGSDDQPGEAEGPGFWDIAPCKAGERRERIEYSEPGDNYTALIDWPPRPATGRVAEVARTPEPSAPEPEVPAEVRPWLDALREVWPEIRAEFSGASWWLFGREPVVSAPNCDALWSRDNGGMLSGKYERALHTYPTPAALVAALKKALGVPEPKPEPTRPALWEWVRAAEGSALGQAYVCRHQEPTESELQMWIDVDGALGGEPDASVDDVPDVFITIDHNEARVYVARDEGGCNACCSTPAELTAALNAAVEENK